MISDMCARTPVMAFFLACGCHPDCDLEAELDQLMVEGTLDCGDWDPEGDDEMLLQCATDAESAGREIRFDFQIELGYAAAFSRGGKIYVAARSDKFVKTDTGIDVYVCAGPLTDALEDIRAHGVCGEHLCNVCPADETCAFAG